MPKNNNGTPRTPRPLRDGWYSYFQEYANYGFFSDKMGIQFGYYLIPFNMSIFNF